MPEADLQQFLKMYVVRCLLKSSTSKLKLGGVKVHKNDAKNGLQMNEERQ